MNASFDGARIHLAQAYNSLASKTLSEEMIEPMEQLRQCVGSFLAMYDKEMQPDDGHDLSEKIMLLEPTATGGAVPV